MPGRQPRKRLSLILLTIVCLVGLILSVQAWRGRAKPFVVNKPAAPRRDVAALRRPAAPDDGYVGGAACATCHAKIAETYSRHPMSRSLATVETAAPLEDYAGANSFEAGPCEYRVERQDGKVWHHELLRDTDGTLLYDISAEIQFVVGSGTRGRSYLTQRNDVLRASSIGWYAKKAWALSPGYQPLDHPHFTRRVTEACLQCHSGRVNIDHTNVNHFPAPAFLDVAISCERCHGPGERHVAYHQTQADQAKPGPANTDHTVPDPIVNPARLPSAEREAVCSQCHLQARERVLRYGRSHQDFRPGNKINDIWTVFLKGDATESGSSAELVTQVEQMQSSQCFQKSAGRLGCTSCHDPHDSPKSESRRNFFQEKCLNCHANQGCSLEPAQREAAPANGTCVVCHMPQLSTQDVPHTSQSDHRILRHSLKSARPPRVPVLTVFEEPGFQLPELEMRRARGLMLALIAEELKSNAAATDAEQLLKPSLAAAPDDTAVLEALGVVCLLQSRRPEAEKYWQTILQKFPQHEQALLRLSILAHETGRTEQARDLLARFLKVNPTFPQLLFKNAQVLAELNELDQAIPFAKQALMYFPRRLPLYDWLAKASAHHGNQAESERYLDLKNRISKQLTAE